MLIKQKMDGISFNNLFFIDQLFEEYRSNPLLVTDSWRSFFAGWELASHSFSLDANVTALIEAYRLYGYRSRWMGERRELSLSHHGIKEEDLDKEVDSQGVLPLKKTPLRNIIKRLEEIYSGSIGIEYGDQKEALQKLVEQPLTLSNDEKRLIFQKLSEAELFEKFLHTKYGGHKWFSLEGAESLVPMLTFLSHSAAEKEGVARMLLGMAHRGRLNILTHLLGQPYESIFQKFDDLIATEDVPYHEGYEAVFSTKTGKSMKITLSANPSHLESVDPVIEGMTRVLQEKEGKKAVLPILIHGDASLSGQGVVYETMQLAALTDYETGGTIHIIIDNQIGFTTNPEEGRSTRFCSDIARTFGLSVIHLDGDDPEAAVKAVQIALSFRQKFHKDLFIRLCCYRKYGHNETDEPRFTQPLTYKLIKERASVRELYQKYLISEGILDQAAAEAVAHHSYAQLQQAFEAKGSFIQQTKPKEADPHSLKIPLSIEQLISWGKEFSRIPSGFSLHPKMVQLLEKRAKMFHSDPTTPILDWSMAEQLAYASLLMEKVNIRISGQDCRRGTFSHRHACWWDQERSVPPYTPLAHLSSSRFTIINSPLSEFAVLGFEFGYSLHAPDTLIIWEAQFGDFANGAQPIIDQYIASGIKKWDYRSAIVLFLPHGYEGQGAEHSSARIERFLQLSADANWRIVNCTTPAQLFHLLRDQKERTPPTPLILFTPKKLLREPRCLSSWNDFISPPFQPIIADHQAREVRRVLFCSGKIYYDLLAEKRTENYALIRIEQLYPLDISSLRTLIDQYKEVKEWYWVQEEPRNGGAWSYIDSIISPLLNHPLRYVGRPPSSSVAIGSHTIHQKEQKALIEAAYNQEKI